MEMYTLLKIAVSCLLYIQVSSRNLKGNCKFDHHGFEMPNGCLTEFSHNPALRVKCLPAFEEINYANLKSGILCASEFGKKNFEQLEERIRKKKVSLTWSNIIDFKDIIYTPLDFSFRILQFLHDLDVKKTNEKMYKELHQLVTEHQVMFDNSAQFHIAIDEILLYEKNLNYFQKNALNDILEKYKQKKFDEEKIKKIRQAKVEKQNLASKFQYNIRHSEDDLAVLICNKSYVSGTPKHILQEWSKNTKKFRNIPTSQRNGPWLIKKKNHDFESYINNSELKKHIRKRLFKIGCFKRHKNFNVIEKFRKNNEHLAKLQGFENFAQYALKDSMAKNSSNVITFLKKLLNGVNEECNQSSEKFNESEIQEYFPKKVVFRKTFEFVENWFGVTFKDVTNSYQKYEKSVKIYEAYDKEKNFLGAVYFDLYMREGIKISQNMVKHLMPARKALNLKPVTVLFTNFRSGETLTFENIQGFFHELGHVLQLILPKYVIEETRDTSELPSMFMELFTSRYEVIKNISSHYATGKPLPESTFRLMMNNKDIGEFKLLISIALVDQYIFSNSSKSTTNLIMDLQREHNISKVVSSTICQIRHIFAFNYDANTYSYIWCEALALELNNYLFKNSSSFTSSADRIRKLIFELDNTTSRAEGFQKLLGKSFPDERLILKYYGCGK